MNTSQRLRKPKSVDATQQLSAAAIAAAASRKSANRSSRFGGLRGAISRTSLPFTVNVRTSFSDKLAAYGKGSNSDEEETAPSSTSGDELRSPKKKAWDSVSTLGLHGPNGPDISTKSFTCSAKSLRSPSVPDIDELDELEPSPSPNDHNYQGAAADQDVSVDLVPEALLQANHPSSSADAKEVKQAKHGKRLSFIKSIKRASFVSHDRNRKSQCTTSSTSEAEVEIMRMEIQELKAMLKEKTKTIVKLEVDLELAHDTIHELKKSLVYRKKNENATGHRISSKNTSSRKPSGSTSAMNLYRSRLSQTEK